MIGEIHVDQQPRYHSPPRTGGMDPRSGHGLSPRKALPRPRTLSELKADPEIADDLKSYMVALIELRARARAAE